MFQVEEVSLVCVTGSDCTVHLPTKDEQVTLEEIYLYQLAFKVFDKVFSASWFVVKLDAAELIRGKVLKRHFLSISQSKLNCEIVFILDKISILGLEMCPNVLFVRVKI